MNHARQMTAVLSFCMLVGASIPVAAQTSPATQPASSQPTTAPSETRYAMRQTRIFGGGAGPLNYPALDTVVDKVIAGVKAKLSSDADRVLSYESSGQDYTQFELEINIKPDNGPPIAKEFMEDVVIDMQAALNETYTKWKATSIEPSENNYARAQHRLDALTEEAAKRREMARQFAGRADSSSKGIQEAAATMDGERQRLELDSVGKTARRQAIEEQIADQSKRIDERVEKDPIAAELEKVVEAREEAVTRIKNALQPGQEANAELADTVTLAAETRAKLLQRRMDAAAESGGETLEALNRELTTLSIDLHEIDARFKFVKQELEKLSEATDALAPIAQLEADIAQERETVKKTADELDRAQRRISESVPPMIEVISRKDLEAPPAKSLFDR